MSNFEAAYNEAFDLRDNAYEAITKQTSEGIHNMTPTDILELMTDLSRAIEGLTATVELFFEALNKKP